MKNKKCELIINKYGETVEADFYGLFQKAWTHGESALVGGFSAGQIAYPVAVIDRGHGLEEVNIKDVKEIWEED